jgi:hypothetical protein
MPARKIPIMATVPACAGVIALIAVPPWEAPGGLEGELRLRVSGSEDVSPAEPDERRLGGLQGKREEQQSDRDVADASNDADEPVPEVAQHVGETASSSGGMAIG